MLYKQTNNPPFTPPSQLAGNQKRTERVNTECDL